MRVLLGASAFTVYRDFGKGIRKYKSRDGSSEKPNGRLHIKNNYGSAKETINHAEEVSPVGQNGADKSSYLMAADKTTQMDLDLEADLDDESLMRPSNSIRDKSDSDMSITSELRNSKNVQN